MPVQVDQGARAVHGGTERRARARHRDEAPPGVDRSRLGPRAVLVVENVARPRTHGAERRGRARDGRPLRGDRDLCRPRRAVIGKAGGVVEEADAGAKVGAGARHRRQGDRGERPVPPPACDKAVGGAGLAEALPVRDARPTCDARDPAEAPLRVYHLRGGPGLGAVEADPGAQPAPFSADGNAKLVRLARKSPERGPLGVREQGRRRRPPAGRRRSGAFARYRHPRSRLRRSRRRSHGEPTAQEHQAGDRPQHHSTAARHG